MAEVVAGGVRPPLWRDVRVLRIVVQVVFILIVAIVVQQMYLNASYELDQQNVEMSYDFLETRAGFAIKEHVISYGANQSFGRAFMVGVTNALTVAGIGIVLATLLGLVIGVGRLSPNWLIRKIAQAYVDVIRNVPALVQVVFWWSAVFLAIPRFDEGLSLFDTIFLSNRGLALPLLRGDEGFGTWWLIILLGMVGGFFVFRWRTRINEATGQPSYRVLASIGFVLAFAVVGYFVLGDAFHIERPTLGARNYIGGLKVTPELAGILIGLVVYTAAFIAEIVRGSILAISKGQKEAAAALGLAPGQQLRLVILPQALRIAVPPVNNQYLNFWKNTSLAFAIGFPDIINISTTVINQSGNELQMFTLVVITYLGISLAISLVMNIVNRAVALRGER